MRPVMVGLGELKVVVKEGELTNLGDVRGCEGREKGEGEKGEGEKGKTHPPIRPLSYPMRRKPRQVREVTAVKRSLPSRGAMLMSIGVEVLGGTRYQNPDEPLKSLYNI
jgi:hypothetical protein